MNDIKKGEMSKVYDIDRYVLDGDWTKLADVIVNDSFARQRYAPTDDEFYKLYTEVFDLPKGIKSFELKETWKGKTKLYGITGYSKEYYDSHWEERKTFSQSYADFRDQQLEKFKNHDDYEIIPDKGLIIYSYILPEKRFIYEVSDTNGIKKIVIRLFKVKNTKYSSLNVWNRPWQCGEIIATDEY